MASKRYAASVNLSWLTCKMKHALIIIMTLLTLVGCKTVNVHIYSLPHSGDIEVEVHVKGSDVETDARLK